MNNYVDKKMRNLKLRRICSTFMTTFEVNSHIQLSDPKKADIFFFKLQGDAFAHNSVVIIFSASMSLEVDPRKISRIYSAAS